MAHNILSPLKYPHSKEKETRGKNTRKCYPSIFFLCVYSLLLLLGVFIFGKKEKHSFSLSWRAVWRILYICGKNINEKPCITKQRHT